MNCQSVRRMAGSPDMIRITIHRSRESCSESILGTGLDSNRDSRGSWGNGLRGTGVQSHAELICRIFLKPLSNLRVQSL